MIVIYILQVKPQSCKQRGGSVTIGLVRYVVCSFVDLSSCCLTLHTQVACQSMGAANVFTEGIMLCRLLSAYTLRVCTCTTSPQRRARY